MEIYVVRSGDTLFRIAARRGLDVAEIARYNEIDPEAPLVPGQTLVLLYPNRTHTVAQGENMQSIANQYGVTVNQILRNNPWLDGDTTLFSGQVLVIDFEQEKQGTLSVNGYAYPYIDRDVLRKTLPYLTYITIFTYGFTPEGELIVPEDEEIIALAREYGVGPLMLISTLTEGGNFSNELASVILNDMAAQERLIDNILTTMRQKGYVGLDVDFEYLYVQDRDAYTAFIQRLAQRLNPEGFIVMVALAPKISEDQPGLLYEGHDYGGLGQVANYVLLMTYEWGYTAGPPMAVAPINKVEEVLRYAVTVIERDKIFMGIPNYGYNWTLPFVLGVSKAPSIGNVAAVELAGEVGAYIQFDPVAQAPHFNYFDQQWQEHEVWFEDARSIQAKLALASQYGFQGVSYWNLMKFFPQNWLVLNALYNIRKVL